MVQPGPGRSPRDQSKRELLTEKRGGTLGISVDNEEELLHGMVKEWSFLSLLQCGSQWFYIQLREEGRAPPPGNPPMEPFLLLRDKSPLQPRGITAGQPFTQPITHPEMVRGAAVGEPKRWESLPTL